MTGMQIADTPEQQRTQRLLSYHRRIRTPAELRAMGIAKRKAKKRKKPRELTAQNIMHLRRAAAIRELASLGLLQAQIATVLSINWNSVHRIGKRHQIKFARFGELDTPLEAQVRAAYAPGGIGPSALGRQLGKTRNTIVVTACRLGLTQPHATKDSHRFVRGFVIPPDRWAEYQELMTLGCTPTEAGKHMRLVPRQSSVPAPQSPL